ncbi:PREDICTED: zinc finger protein CONSTANS-LIKE 9-like [Tarenaya hassleriana]|uniref:zinc finger protein CONSTANS-LIKE 9-like n=1 Tax=Tarenaya hassleriana TaxID=28532 RepID=UPI00053C39A7|nr:PREDICTED: zinc finger protein CONSTANS-LIKE 9-like [Tarenaya hassleriana]
MHMCIHIHIYREREESIKRERDHRMKKKCELCGGGARMYCESDQASLCWDCDHKVHGANFLVAKHTRFLLCSSCQSLTPWNATGPRLGPTVSACDSCFSLQNPSGSDNRNLETNRHDYHEDLSGDAESYNDGEEDDDDDDGEEYSDEEAENQVVPWSEDPSKLQPPEVCSSSSVGGGGGGGFSAKRNFGLFNSDV